MGNTSSIIGLVNNAALLLALGALHDAVGYRPRGGKRAIHQIFAGAILGAIGIAVMLNPWQFTPGVVFDTRSVLLSVSGLFFGTVPTVLATLMMGGFRLYTGGTGAWTGVGVIVTSGAVGVAWRYLRRHKLEDISVSELYAVGLVVHIAMLLWMFSLPWPLPLDVLSKISLPVMVIYPVGTVLLGWLMVNQGARYRAEEALSRSETKFKGLFENSPDTVVLADLNGTFLDINRVAPGYKKEDVIGSRFTDYLTPEQAKLFNQTLEKAIKTGTPQGYEVDIANPQGLTSNWYNCISPIRNEGEITQVVVHCTDITEHKRTEEALQQERDRAQRYLDIAGVVLVALDARGTVTLINQKGGEVLGYEPEEIVGRNWFDGFLPGSIKDQVRAVFDKLMAGEIEADQYYENAVVTRSGEERIIAWHNTILRDEDNTIGTLSSGEDITGRVQTDVELRRRNRELALLHRAGQALISVLDLDQVLVTIIDETCDLLDADGVSVWLIDTQTGDLVCQQASGPQSETVRGWRLRLGEGIAGWVARHGESLLVLDARADDRHFKQVDERTGLETRSILCVPLSVKEQVIGVLQVIDVEPDRFEPSDLILVEQLATTAVIAIQNARLYEQAQQEISERKRAEREVQRHAERLRALRAIDGAILAAWSPREIAQSALCHMQSLIPYWRASVALFERDGHRARVLAIQAEGETGLQAGAVLPLDEIGGLEELEQGKIFVVEDILAEAQPSAAARALHAEGLRSYVTVPLVTQGELIGFLNIGSDKPRGFIPEHVDIAHEVAGQIAVAFRQARLQEEIQRHVAELEQRVVERTAELSIANAELARASRLKDEFLASMSHELRTPLNTVLGLSEALQEQVYGPLNERQLRSLGTIEESGRHLLALINDILDVSKIEAGKVQLDIAPVSIRSVCQASLGLIKQSAFKKQLKTYSGIDNTLITIQADERRLKQILVNLLSNAVKFTPEGGEVGLEVVGDREREAVHFTVWDTGVGISDEDMARLFQPFVQLDSSLSREHAGTGLGLALVRRLTELHGGGVSLESGVGLGSRFTVSLPWRMGGSDQYPVISEQYAAIGDQTLLGGEENGLTTENRSPITVLLAEDNEENIQTIADYLRAQGCRVVVARNGAEAIERAGENTPDVILMDVQMPEMDGLEATRRIRADVTSAVSTAPIIALTALAMPGDQEQCLEAGANAYLSKPVGLRQLVKTIEKLLSARMHP
jgi:PAS domain S-box-containing protein